MKMARLVMAGALAAACLSGAAYGQIQEEFFSDSFSGLSRDNAKWRDSIYMDSTARFRVSNGRVVLSRKRVNPDPFQQIQWDARFVRIYDGNDYLQIGATVRMPNKIRSGDGAVSLGIGLVSGGAHFVELMVEDNAAARTFSIFVENTETTFSDFIFYDAPQNVTLFDLIITYSAASDNLAFYWSVPGVERLFRIGQIRDFGATVGGVGPRRIQPYIIGLIYNDALVPTTWRVFLDNFYAFREDAP